jgi:hypothetical protein
MRPSGRNAVQSLRLFEHVGDEIFAALCQAALVQTFPPHVELVCEGELPDLSTCSSMEPFSFFH